ncbi:AraC family transcriptional regulator [Aliiruegeria lutimaris]|uniref:Transcriptional regulator, AraC family n=1 Tax=Aliiruegeria lutimaris TaxID=571298 RepID=A0A1G9GGN8_9RHOB|nr:AraC family transcriptional regulator [Aliiruegeria lutimaris]SDK99840.1 transcriptional regulator, AraC family [Aliiruegeria lutimaris]
MKPEIPKHSAIWGQVLVEELIKTGISQRVILKELGIARSLLEDPDARWSFDKTAMLFEKARALTGDDLLGFRMAQSPDLVKKAGLLAYVGVSAPTIGGYLRNITRFQRVIGDASKTALEEGPELARLAWHYDVPASIPTGQYAEFGAVGTVFALRDYANRQIRPKQVEFAHQRLTGTEALDRFFGCNVLFGASENSIAFKTADMDVPLLTADDNLQRTLSVICENTLAQMPQTPNSMARMVERQITARLASGTAQQDAIAAELGMSARTLARRLTEEGTSFAAVVANLRKALARDYLLNSTLPLTEIAYLLGYSDASTFSTAFRRWYGQPPSDFRERPATEAPLT